MLITGHLGMGCIECGVVWEKIKSRSLDVFSWSSVFQLIDGLSFEFAMQSEQVTA